MKVCATVDMDNYREYRSLIDPDGADPEFSFYRDAVPRFLDVFDAHSVSGTFFVVGRDCRVAEHRALLREIHARGHEVANHSWSHPYDLRSRTRAEKEAEIADAGDAIADAVGEHPVGFRCPSGELDGEVLEILDEHGYLYDSTVFPTPFMWIFMVYGKLFVRHPSYGLGAIRAALSPRGPYLPSAERFYRERAPAASGPDVVEIPISVWPPRGLPFYATLFRLLGPGVFDRCVRWHGDVRGTIDMLYHLIDLVDLSGSALDDAVRRTPGLGLSFERRHRFVDRSLASLRAAGDAVPLREAAAAYRASCGLPPRREVPGTPRPAGQRSAGV